jgi:DNA-binding MarR family transcriptional regulator
LYANESDDTSYLNIERIDPVSLEVFHSLFKFIRFHSQLLFKLTSEKGIYPGQAVCLWFINQNSGISQRDLAEKMHVAPPTVTHMLQKLEKAGLIIRKDDEHDQRLSRIYLTDAGIDMLSILNDILADIINTSLNNLSCDQKNNLVSWLNIISSNISNKL